MMVLYFLVLFAVGILRPIRNALALDGLAESQFYQVYLVSAVVILFAPAFNHVAGRVQWRTLIPATAAFFAINLLIFRLFYSEGSRALGMIFYGWYDLFAAALVTQFFMAVQIFFNARDAKSAIPLVIAAGSVGATLGGLTTGMLAQTIGTPNLLFLAAFFVAAFSLALPFVWTGYPPVRSPGRRVEAGKGSALSTSEFVRVFSNRQIQLIAGLVLVTVVVKTLVDYEFNEAVAAFAGDRDAISSFQGYVFGAINWLPIVILLPLGPMLKRWGVGFAVLMLPVAMLGFTAALAMAFSVWTATLAKAGDSTFRYSAERTGREILYVPVPTELKLKAKAYVDMAVEKGFGKASSGLLILALLNFMDYQQIAWVALGIALVWCAMALAAKREYVRALAESIRGRFANLEGGFASLTERSTLAMVEAALRGGSVEVAFGLDLVEQAGSVDAQHLADEMELLLEHSEEEVRVRVLRLLVRFPELVRSEKIRTSLADESEPVREGAVAALVAKTSDEAAAEAILTELLGSSQPDVRIATLSWLVDSARRGASDGSDPASAAAPSLGRRVGSKQVAALLADSKPPEALPDSAKPSDASARHELALAAGLLEPGPQADTILGEMLEDADHRVLTASIRSAGLNGSRRIRSQVLAKLAHPACRGPARQALVGAGTEVIELCAEQLRNSAAPLAVRRNVPSVLAYIPDQRSVSALFGSVADRNTPREVRYQSLKALNKLRVRRGQPFEFDENAVLSVVAVEVSEAVRYADFGAAFNRADTLDPALRLLRTALREAWEDRQEATFRLLGLVFPPDEVYRSHSAVIGSDERGRANALEWLERTLGRPLFNRILPVLQEAPRYDQTRAPTAGANLEDRRRESMEELAHDADPWIRAVATKSESGGPEPFGSAAEDQLDQIEKVFLIQKVDFLQAARSAHLGLLASIAEELEVDKGEVLLHPGESNHALYVVVRGAVELTGVGDQSLTLGENEPFGTWSLIDSDPSIVGARALEHTRLIRITRSDFRDLLADHPELATGILQGLARRVRSLVA